MPKSKADASARVALPDEQPVVISIARDYGAEGHEIGKLLSVELGIPLYDNELLVRSALKSGLEVDQAAAYDERAAAEMYAFLPDRIDALTVSDKLYKAMRQVILDLGTSPCIIEGRLSDYILRRNPNLVSVLVTASFDERVEIVRAKRGLSKRDGRKLVKKMQRGREDFYRRYSAGKWDLHANKDLVVDRAAFGREGCCAIIASAYRAKVRLAQEPDGS
ncbi:MAG: cytidylate kinase-like family protein [Atopobiaceae bacterium]|jgi:cytidylate kinase|nr:cytidylate kinase-like family protein [Atopobiaceae bacterium]